jgi:ribose/xylose/arabinose/galactoside ABC-type transport system permease subunit
MSNYSDQTSKYSDQPVSQEKPMGSPPPPARQKSRFWAIFDPRDFGVLHVLLLLIVVFSIWQPDTFPNYKTFTAILSQNAIPGILALGLTVPLAAGEFDLSIGYVLGTASIFLAWCLGSTGMGVVESIGLTLAMCLAFGVVNSMLVVGVGLNSFIATLATGSLLQAVIQTISHGLTLANGIPRISNLATDNIAEITLPAIVMLAICGLLWLLLSLTPAGRRMYATGLARDAAILSGVRTGKLRMASFLVSAIAAGIAGILVTAQVGAASPTVGPPLMIPAFAAAFLGSTQVRPGFFNAWGTLLAVLMLGTLNYGLALAGVPEWVPYLSTGSVLIVALALGRIREQGVPIALKRLVRRRAAGRLPVAVGEGGA